MTSLDSPSWIRVGGRLTRASDQSYQRSDQGDMDSQIVTVDQFATAMASIQEAIVDPHFHVRPHLIGETRFLLFICENLIFEKKSWSRHLFYFYF